MAKRSLSALLVELLSVIKYDIPGDEWYVDDGDRAMYSRPHYASFEPGLGAGLGRATEALRRAPDGSDGRGAHGDGDRKVFNSVVKLLNIAAQMRSLLGTPAVAVMLRALSERERQQAPVDAGGEGWTTAHDDAHEPHVLAMAAAYYAMAASGHKAFQTPGKPPTLVQVDQTTGMTRAPANWPWESSWFKPKDREHNTKVAIALLSAHSESSDRRVLREAALALPGAPIKALLKDVFEAAGVPLPTGEAFDAAMMAARLHSLK